VAVRTSAALLAYRVDDAGVVRVFVGHMGGPFWARRDAGGWSIPKGEYDAATEVPLDVARREFAEEIGVPAPSGPVLDLGEWRQPSGKRVRAFAVAAGEERVRYVGSNTFQLEWPPGSGRVGVFPEIDRAEWRTLADARRLVVSGQVPILDALLAAVRVSDPRLRDSPQA
jgi:predicted NUDIX family NTP pyrophosphohydrolase